MRIAVISDIHGDLDSLRRALTAIDRAAIDQIWCLGDIVGLGATAPAEVVDLVRDRCALALAGNHDRWVTGQLSLSMLPLPRQRAQLQWQHRVLSNEQLTWLAALPAQGRAHDVELWHGSSQDPITGWSSSPQDAADHLARQQARIGLVGHTHRPLIAERNGTTIDYDENPETRRVSGIGSLPVRRWRGFRVDRESTDDLVVPTPSGSVSRVARGRPAPYCSCCWSTLDRGVRSSRRRLDSPRGQASHSGRACDRVRDRRTSGGERRDRSLLPVRYAEAGRSIDLEREQRRWSRKLGQ